MSALSEAQLLCFRTFGYLLLPQLLNVNDLSVLGDELDHGLAIQFPEIPFDGSRRHWPRLTDENTPFSASLMENSRFLTPAQQVCGPECTRRWYRCESICWGYRLAPRFSSKPSGGSQVYFSDELTAEIGALRVIPGSHLLTGQKRGIFEDGVKKLAGSDIPAHTIETQPGDLIALDIRTWHASYGGNRNRCSFNLDYVQTQLRRKNIEQLKSVGRSHAGSIQHFGLKRQYNYSKNWLFNPHQSQVRQRWIDRFEDIGYLAQVGVA